MNPLATACPGCGTAFRVGPAQLEAADGLVRCSACNAVFDARTHAVKTVSAAAEAPARSIDEDYIAGLILGEPPEDRASARASVDPAPAEPPPSPAAPPATATDDPAVATPAPETAVATTQQTDAPAVMAEPAVEATAILPRIPVELPRGQGMNAGVHRRVLAWCTGLLLAALLITVQQIWLGRERHAQNSALRPRYERLCAVLGCELPPFRDIRRIRSDGLLVRPDPARPGTLLIDATIVNRAEFPQAFPGIRIDFSDIQGTPVTQRTFRPGEYLLAAALREGRMLPGEILKIHIEMPDPGERATNYELQLTESRAD